MLDQRRNTCLQAKNKQSIWKASFQSEISVVYQNEHFVLCEDVCAMCANDLSQ